MYVIVCGITSIGRLIVRGLMHLGHDVVVVDRDRSLCEELYADTGVVAVQGDATHPSVLKKAGIEKADILIACENSDSRNLAISIIAKKFGVKRIIVTNQDPEYKEVFLNAGINSVVGYVDMIYERIMNEVENPKIKRLTTVADGKGELILATVSDNAKIAGKTVKEIASSGYVPEDLLFVAIIRGENLIIPRGNTKIRHGDSIILMTRSSNISDIDLVI